MDVVEALNQTAGAARTAALLRAGCTEQALRTAAAMGSVRRVERGVWATQTASPDAVLAARLNAQFTCLTALAHMGLPLPTSPMCAHLAVPDSFTRRNRDTGGARLHYQVAPRAPGIAVDVAMALDTAAACLDETWHLVAVDAALNRGLITLGDIMGFTRAPRQRRDFLLAHADARAQSPGETIARLRLVRAGFAVRPQAYIEGAGSVDLEVNGTLLIQVDGYEHHSDKPSFKRDRQKGRAVIKAGRPLLSYAASELLGHWTPDIVQEARAAIAAWEARGQRPSGPSSS